MLKTTIAKSSNREVKPLTITVYENKIINFAEFQFDQMCTVTNRCVSASGRKIIHITIFDIGIVLGETRKGRGSSSYVIQGSRNRYVTNSCKWDIFRICYFSFYFALIYLFRGNEYM